MKPLLTTSSIHSFLRPPERVGARDDRLERDCAQIEELRSQLYSHSHDGAIYSTSVNDARIRNGQDSRNSSHAFLGASHTAVVILRSKSTRRRRLAQSLGILDSNAARNPHPPTSHILLVGRQQHEDLIRNIIDAI